jgi:hypothetical protein
VIQKRAATDPIIVLAIARVFAVSAAILLVISLTHFFIIPTMCIALVAVCFAISSVAAPEER